MKTKELEKDDDNDNGDDLCNDDVRSDFETVVGYIVVVAG